MSYGKSVVCARITRRFCLFILISLWALVTSSALLAESDHPANDTKEANQQTLPHVLSMNLCADQLVLLLADPSQIKALSTLSQDKPGSYFYHEAQNYPQVGPSAEQILPLAPDIVITGPYTPRYTQSLLTELGFQFEALTIAESIDAIITNIERVGKLLQQESKAARIVNAMRSRLADLASRSAALDARLMLTDKQTRPTAMVYATNGYTVGRKTLKGSLMELAGWRNLADDKGFEQYGVISLEELIRLAPDALVESPYSPGTYSRGQMLTKHPAIRHAGLDPTIITVASNLSICAGPWSLDIAEKMLSARESLHE